MTTEDRRPSAGLNPLARARLDELLEELLERVGAVLDAQDRLRRLLDAVVSMAGDLSLDSVLQRIVTTASELVGARYGALGVLAVAGSTDDRRLREFVTHGLTQEQRDAIGDLPRGHGLLGLIIDQPQPVRLDAIGDQDPPMRARLLSAIPEAASGSRIVLLDLRQVLGQGPLAEGAAFVDRWRRS